MSMKQSKKATFAYWTKKHRKMDSLYNRGLVEFKPGRFSARCRSCDNLYEIYFSVDEFDQFMSYCGGSLRCLP